MTEMNEAHVDIYFEGQPPRDVLEEWLTPFAGQRGVVNDLGNNIFRFRAESVSPVFGFGYLYLERPGAQIAITQQRILRVLNNQGEEIWIRNS